jgi:hypothetical protein
MRNRPASGKSLSIKTKNLDFPEVGVVTELYDEEVIVKLADGSLTYAYFTATERDAMAKLTVKMQVGSTVNVAVQRGEARKIVEVENDAGVAQSVKMYPVRIQEVQPVYLEKGSIVEITSDYAKVKLEKTSVVQTIIFSIAEKQMMEELNIRFAVGQVVHINIRKIPAYGRAIDIKDIGSPEPETAFLISPKPVKTVSSPEALSSPEAVAWPSSNASTVFSFLKEINIPKRQKGLVLNPARTLAIKYEESVVSTPVLDCSLAVDKTDETKEKRLSRRKVRLGNFLPTDVIAATSLIVPSLQVPVMPVAQATPAVVPVVHASEPVVRVPEMKRIVIPAALEARKVALLKKLNGSIAMFPAVSSAEKYNVSMPITSTKPVNNTANHNQLYQVLHDTIFELVPLAKNKVDTLLINNLSIIAQSSRPINKKLQLIIAEVKKYNTSKIIDQNSSFYPLVRNAVSINTIEGFAKLAASINLEENDEKLFSQLKLILPGTVRPVACMLPSLNGQRSR